MDQFVIFSQTQYLKMPSVYTQLWSDTDIKPSLSFTY